MALINNKPVFVKTPRNAQTGTTFPVMLTAAANDFDGTSANNVLVFTADATNGSFVQRLRFKAAGTNVATLARIFINNGSSNTTAANNILYEELALSATTASTSLSTSPPIDLVLNLPLQAGFKIYVGLTTAVAAGWDVVPIAGDY